HAGCRTPARRAPLPHRESRAGVPLAPQARPDAEETARRPRSCLPARARGERVRHRPGGYPRIAGLRARATLRARARRDRLPRGVAPRQLKRRISAQTPRVPSFAGGPACATPSTPTRRFSMHVLSEGAAPRSLRRVLTVPEAEAIIGGSLSHPSKM